MDKQLMDDLEKVGGILIASSLRGCDEILIEQPDFSARIALWGGHLTSFIPQSGVDVLFKSENAGCGSRFDSQHMGVPVCWPWFSRHSTEGSYPSHGLVRYLRWQLSDVDRYKNGDVKVILKLNSDQHPFIEDMWPQAFELRLVFRLGDGFRIDFFAANLSDKPMEVSEALHTYFHVGDSSNLKVQGLDGLTYIDKVDGNNKCIQTDDFSPDDGFDRVYLGSPEQTCIVDPVLNRKVIISTKGSADTVVWNPGKEKAQKRVDMNDDDYQRFICLEPANVLKNTYQLESGEIHQLRMKVKIEPLD